MFATAVISEGQHSDTVVLVICPLTVSIIQDQVKDGNPLGLDCAAIKVVKDLSNIGSVQQVLLHN